MERYFNTAGPNQRIRGRFSDPAKNLAGNGVQQGNYDYNIFKKY